MLNPMFDNRARDSPEQPFFSSHESAFVGEASCAAFCNRLLRCFDDTYTPCNAGFSNYHPLNGRLQPMLDPRDAFPERMHAKLLLNVARRFIGNYHPLFLEVTFMQEMDAVYRRELTPSSLWLCKFYALMALGEIYTNRRGAEGSGIVPGTRYYERAVYMFQDHDLHEEPCLMHVEILTLLVRACKALAYATFNRRPVSNDTDIAVGLDVKHLRSSPDSVLLQRYSCTSGHEHGYASRSIKQQYTQRRRKRESTADLVGFILLRSLLRLQARSARHGTG